MAYTNGIALTNSDLLDAVQSALVTNGWTLEYRGVDNGSGDPANTDYRRDVLWVSSGDGYFGLAPEKGPTEGGDIFRVYGATSYSPVLSSDDQADSNYLSCNYFTLPCVRYHIISSAAYFYLVVEGTTKNFRHLGFGHLDKMDSYTGGQFMYGHYTSSYLSLPMAYAPSYNAPSSLGVLVQNDGQVKRWTFNGSSRSFPTRCYGATAGSRSGMSAWLMHSNSGQFNNQTVLVPAYFAVQRAGGYQSPLGIPPDFRNTSIAKLSDSVTDISLGPDNWKIFPAGVKGSSNPLLDAYDIGMAFKVP